MNIVPKLKNFTFVLFAFAIPFSVALTNILIVLFTFLWIFEFILEFLNKKEKALKEIIIFILLGPVIWKILCNPIKISPNYYWIGSLIVMAILYLLGLFNGDFHADSIYVLKRVLLLLFFIPIYTSDISLENCNRAIHVFLVTNFFAALAAISINFELIQPFFSDTSISAFLKYNYHNILLSFSSILSLYLFVRSNHKYSVIYLLLIIIFTISIFTEAGRAGQLTFNVFFLLYAIFLIKKKLKFSIVIALFLIVTNFLSYSNSPIFKHRVDHLTHIVKNDGQKKNKKSEEKDIRYLFTKSGFELVMQKPIFGYGTGSFSEVFKNHTNTSYDLNKHKTPHNNYLYILFELGVIGLLAFLSLFYFQIKELLYLNKSNFEALLLPLFLLVLLFFDSYMFIFTITIFYIYMYKIFQKI